MATGFSTPLETRHDTIYEYCCTTCAHQNLNAEALFYCKDCRKLLCEECNKYHAKFFEGHRVLGREEVAEWGDVKPVTSSLMCDEHPGKELEMYCEDHDVVCCYICISVKHRSCKEVKLVSEVSKGIQKESDFKSFLSEAAKTKSRLKILHDKEENNIKMLHKARGEITASFKNMRQKINQIVDKLEDDSITELDKLLTMLKEKVTIDRDTCYDLIDKIQKLLSDIQTLGKQCDELAFQGYKKCSEQMASADKLLSSIQNVDFQIKFIPDSKIEELLYSLETLGSFYVMPADHSDSFKYKGFAPLLTPPDHVYSIEKKQTYTVKTSKDLNPCYITGICQLPEGQMAIVDRNNDSVKLLSAFRYVVLDELWMSGVVQDICYTTGTELAVSVCLKDSIFSSFLRWFKARREIQFINAGNGKLSHTKSIQLDHNCYGIAYHNAQLYVGSTNALFVYNMSGRKLKKIYEDTSNESENYESVKKCCLSNEGSRIYITNTYSGLLLILDNSGKLLSTFSDPELQQPADVCVAENGSVFVFGLRSNTVLQVDRKGKRKMTTLARKEDGICGPRSLCYDRKTHKLLVGQGGDNNLVALQLQ